MLFSDESQNLFSFTSISEFEFFNRGLYKVIIRPIDEKIKQINIKVTVQTEKEESTYEEVLEYTDFFNISKSNKTENLILNKLVENNDQNENKNDKIKFTDKNIEEPTENNSLFWIKLYLEDYLRRVQHKLKLNKSQREADHIINSCFILSNEVYMRKVYKNSEKILKSIQEESNSNEQVSNDNLSRSLLLKVDPSILNYPNDIFTQPFLINLPKKLNQSQNIISEVELNQTKKELAEKQIENIFFDNKFK